MSVMKKICFEECTEELTPLRLRRGLITASQHGATKQTAINNCANANEQLTPPFEIVLDHKTMYTSYLPIPNVSSSSRYRPVPNITRLRAPLLQILATFFVCVLAFYFFFDEFNAYKVTQRYSPAIHGRWKEIHYALRIPPLDHIQRENPTRNFGRKQKSVFSFSPLHLAASGRRAKSLATTRETSSAIEERLLELARSFHSAAEDVETMRTART
jgi:hypothetical protein